MNIIWLGLILLAGFAYRAGGASWGHTKIRDCGVPLIMLIAMWKLGLWHWSLLICFGLMWGALTSYKYFLPKPKDYLWYHYALHGFFIGLAMLPYCIFAGHWLAFILRTILLAVTISIWSHYLRQVDIEEGGRGALITGSLLLFML